MTKWTRGALLGLAALGVGASLAGGPASAAQTGTSSPQETPGDALSRNLRTLVANPRSVDALMGAGKAALQVGDAQAALTFFARAEDEAPRDGRIKMWIGSALVQLEQPHAALKFFKDAVDLGVAEAELAGDRGLAYDIAGDQRRAQHDYRLALQQGPNAEVTRRLALSLAIGGEREPALRLLDEQPRSPAGERTRALVLALTGDAAAADRAVERSMAPQQAAALEPFLARLPTLSPADRALAVHMGHFPKGTGAGTGVPSTYAMNSFRANVASPTDAGRPDPLQPGLGRTTGALVRTAPPQRDPAVVSSRVSPPAASARPAEPGLSWSLAPPSGPATRNSVASSAPVASPAGSTAAPAPNTKPTALALAHPLDIRRRESSPTAATHPSRSPAPAGHSSRLAALAATVATIKDVPPPRTKGGPAAGKSAGAGKPKPRPAKKPETPEASRHWVQIGIGEDEDALPGEYARLKARAGKLLAGRAAWTAPMGETNRILVGPFPSKDDAQDFVNELAEKKLRALAWTSGAGEKVAKLPAK